MLNFDLMAKSGRAGKDLKVVVSFHVVIHQGVRRFANHPSHGSWQPQRTVLMSDRLKQSDLVTPLCGLPIPSKLGAFSKKRTASVVLLKPFLVLYLGTEKTDTSTAWVRVPGKPEQNGWLGMHIAMSSGHEDSTASFLCVLHFLSSIAVGARSAVPPS